MSSISATLLMTIAILGSVNAIGERTMDLNVISSMIRGFSDIFTEVNTTEVDTEKMMGRWHQMYRAAINFDVFRTEMFCQVSYFRPNLVMGPDGFSVLEAYHVVSANGPIEAYLKDVSKSGPGQYWVYPHQYFFPHQFYVMKVGPEINGSYQYVVASDQNKLALTILARDPQEYRQKYEQEVVSYLQENRIGGDVFWNAPKPIPQGPDCRYPSEKETFARRVLSEQLKAKNINPSQLFNNQRFPVAPQRRQTNPGSLFSNFLGQGLRGGR